MKKLFIILATLFVAVSFSSCDKNDEGGESNKPLKLVSKIQGIDPDDEIRSYSFYYDQQNRISMIVEEYSWNNGISGTQTNTYTTNISYSGNTIQVKDNWDTAVAIVNNGLITSATATSNSNSDRSTKSTYIYNGNYLVETQSTAQEENGTWSWVYKMEWSNGDLVCQIDDKDGDKTTYEYTDILNKTNIDFNGLLEGYTFEETAIEYGFTYGLLGNINTHLMKSTSWIGGDDNETYTSSLSYDFDKDGCPTAIRITYDNGNQENYHITYK